MRLKRIFYVMLASVMMIACASLDVGAVGQGEQKAETQVVYASGRFSMDVPANTTVKASSSFPLEVGEVVTIKATYSPFTASVDFGLIAPDGLFYGLNADDGSFDEAIEVNQRGYYTLAVKNNSSETVHVSGHVNY